MTKLGIGNDYFSDRRRLRSHRHPVRRSALRSGGLLDRRFDAAICARWRYLIQTNQRHRVVGAEEIVKEVQNLLSVQLPLK
jgi:hypothetical protein